VSSSLLNYSTLPENVNQTLSQIPNYDDVGVSYKSYSKILTTSNQYQLNKQTPHFMYIGAIEDIPPSGATTYSFLRSQSRQDPNKTFYVTSIQLDISQSTTPNQLKIYTGNINNPRFSTVFNAGEKHIIIPILDSPRDFKDDTIIIELTTPLTSGSYIFIGLYGWEE
jgi:hypothetical protein